MNITRPTTIFAVFTLLAAFSCFDPNIDDNNAALPENDLEADLNYDFGKYNLWQKEKNTMPRYDGSDSGPIDVNTARIWIDNFSKASFDKVITHYFDRSSFVKVLSQNGCKGIRIHHAISNEGEKKMIITGVDEKGNNLTKALLTTSSDKDEKLTNGGNFIDLLTAKSWIENFKKVKDPEEIISHYFGQNVILEILARNECTGIRIYYATTDTYENKLIIAGTQNHNEDVMTSLGTMRTQSGGPLVDYSFPCPSVCGPGL